MNVPPHILEQAIAARHADLVRQADAARLAARPTRRRRSRVRLRAWFVRTPAPGRGYGPLVGPNA